jgi:SAM-dependent methyltransferase
MQFLKAIERATFRRWLAIPTIGPGRASWAFEWARGSLRDPMQHHERRARRECPCCGFAGIFVSARRNGNREFRCPRCKSRPRDRFLTLLLDRYGLGDLTARRVLHFAPEWPLFNRLRHSPRYVGADIKVRRNANAVLDITAIASPEASFDVLICNHVLEHLPNDTAALAECRRVLAPGGIAFFSVPVDMDRTETWEPPPGMPKAEVERICGWDHKRLYGRDFINRLGNARFSATAVRATRAEMDRYRVLDSDVFFIGQPV